MLLENLRSCRERIHAARTADQSVDKSFFSTWALFDLPFGKERETIGTCLLDVAELLEMDPFMIETIRQFQDSRMGIYENCGIRRRPVSVTRTGHGQGIPL